MKEIMVALLGAIAAGLFQTITGIIERRRARAATLLAVAAEVDALCTLIRDQRYLEEVEGLAAAARNPLWEGISFVVDIRSDYFEVFSALAPNLGSLKPEHARDIVRFYALCKTAVDSMRPDGPIALHGTREERLNAAIDQAAVFRGILALGDKIVTYPKKPLSRLPLRIAG